MMWRVFLLLLDICLLYSVPLAALQLPRCPYPLVEDLEPCICEVDEQYRKILTCFDFQRDFTEEMFGRIVEAFDYNNEIYSVLIDLDAGPSYQYKFHPQLNATNLGKLNITNFSLKHVEISENLFGRGAFSGSAGSITNITVQQTYGSGGSIDLGSQVLQQASPTLQSLTLERVSALSSTTFMALPFLEEVSLKRSIFPSVPSSLFVAENVPNIRSIALGVQNNMNIATNSFKDLQGLTHLELSAKRIGFIQRFALNNLPILSHLQLDGINIETIEEDAFKDLTALEDFHISDSELKELPRIFSNSPKLKMFNLTDSELVTVDENAFTGLSSLDDLDLSGNSELLELRLSNLRNLTSIDLNINFKLEAVHLSEMPRLDSILLEHNYDLSNIHLDNLPSMTNLSVMKDNQETSLSITISNCHNLMSLSLSRNNLANLALTEVDALLTLDLEYNQNLNHTGLGTSLHSIMKSDAEINLRGTNVRNLDEFVFRPLLEIFTSAEISSGYIDVQNVYLDCGCDVKWIIEDFHVQTDLFKNAKCTDETSLADVDPILLEMMCPPEQ